MICSSKQPINKQKQQMMINFINHCAILIQSNFKRYQQQKYYRKFLPIYKRFKQLLFAGFQGWKTRRLLKLNIFKNKITQIKEFNIKSKFLQLRISKRDFTDDFVRFYKNGTWLQYYKKEKRIPLTDKSTKNSIMIVMKKPNLKQIFSQISKQANNIKVKLKPKNVIKNSCQYKNQTQNDENRQITHKNVKKQSPNQSINQTDKESLINKKLSINKKPLMNKKPPTCPTKKQKAPLIIQIQPQLQQVNNMSTYQTPCSIIKIKKEDIQTKIKGSIPQKNQLIQDQQEMEIKSIADSGNHIKESRRSGLQMTLSRKYQKISIHSITNDQFNQINTKKSIYQDYSHQTNNNMNQSNNNKNQSNNMNQSNNNINQSNNNMKQKKNNMKQNNNKMNSPGVVSDFLLNNHTEDLKSTLKFKRQDFQQKKLEHKRKVDQFKKTSLK